jgi:hypothetical protein
MMPTVLIKVELLAKLVFPYLDSPRGLGGALAAYEAACDERLTESYHNTLSVARLEVQNERVCMLKVIERDPVLVDRYFSVVSGVLEELGNEERGARCTPHLSTTPGPELGSSPRAFL